MLRTQESAALFETEERIRALAKARRAGETEAAVELAAEVAALCRDAARATASAFAVYFDLVNLAEEAHRIARPARPRARPAPRPDRRVDRRGGRRCSRPAASRPRQMAALLGALRIELVLTAHPTEAKRRTVLSKLQRIGEALRRLHDPDLLPRERDAVLATLRAEITALWLTERARTTRPAVTDEVRTGLYFVDEVFWDALPRIAADLEARGGRALPGLAPPPGWLTLASWIGGDRDGNPSVVTAGDRGDAAPAPGPRRRAASPLAPGPGPPPQRERPALSAAAGARAPGSTPAAPCRRTWRISSSATRASPIASRCRCSPPTSRRRRTRT